VAWSDFASLVAGTSQMQLSHFNDIRSALIERCDWVGDSTQKTAAQALSTTNPFNTTWLIAARDICQALCTQYNRPGLAYASGSAHGFWSVVSMKNYLHSTYGEPGGMGYIAPNYNWILRPTRKGTLTTGKDMPAATYHPYLEHIMGLYYVINDILRWIPTTHVYTGPIRMKSASKASFFQSTPAIAWTAMKAATPALSGFVSTANFASCSISGGSSFNGGDQRGIFYKKVSNAWLVAPSGFDAVKFLFKTGVGVSFLGPYKMLANITATASGAYTTGSAFKSSFSMGAANTYLEFDADNPGNWPVTTGTIPMLIYNPTYDTTQTANFDESAGTDAANLGFTLKPTTSYGT